MKPTYVHEKLVTMCELNNIKILTTLLQYFAARWLADANTKCPGVVVLNENWQLLENVFTI